MHDWLYLGLDIAFWAIAVAWVIYTLPRLIAVRRILPLPERTERSDGVRVSVVVTARNEERRIEDTVRRLLAQRGIEIEIVVVDDRSTDGTPHILERLVAEHTGIRHVRVDVLPAGWLGKTHACQVGAEVASGNWLLFADADAWMLPDLVARAVSAGTIAGVEHVALFPREHRPDFLASAASVLFAVSLLGSSRSGAMK